MSTSVSDVIKLLDQTIRGKMTLLDQLNANRRMASSAELIALDVTIEYLLINIGELERIRRDLLEVQEL